MGLDIGKIIKSQVTFQALTGVASFSAGIAVGLAIDELIKRRSKSVEVVVPAEKQVDDAQGVLLDFDLNPVVQIWDEKTILSEAPVSFLSDEQFAERVIEKVIEQEPAGLTDAEDDPDDEGAPREEGDVVFTTEEHLARVEEQQAESRNVWDSAKIAEGWDYKVEVKGRTETAPYVIHVEEYLADEFNFDQRTITYYQGDDVMCDEDDVPIYNYREVVGELKFGHGSEDPTTFYVRNPVHRGEYEVLLNQGMYQVEVAGLQIEDEAEQAELRHSMSPRKFRMNRE